jgi:hypothetical protein
MRKASKLARRVAGVASRGRSCTLRIKNAWTGMKELETKVRFSGKG